MKNRISLTAGAVGLTLALTAFSCGKSRGAADAGSEDVKWNVEVYAVVPFDSIPLTTDGTVLPLTYSYAVTDTARVSALLAANDSLLAARGYVWQWVKYGSAESVDLVVMPSAPLLREEVTVTDVSPIADCDGIVQVAFRFDDRRRWEEITDANVGRRLAIAVDGRVLSAPQVNMAISGGACAVTLPTQNLSELLPGREMADVK